MDYFELATHVQPSETVHRVSVINYRTKEDQTSHCIRLANVILCNGVPYVVNDPRRRVRETYLRVEQTSLERRLTRSLLPLIFVTNVAIQDLRNSQWWPGRSMT